MKEPKYPKLGELPKDHKFDFFAEGIFPEEIEEKKKQNKIQSTKKQNPFPFARPIQPKKPPNTQKEDDDLVPFFAKNYPQSSESEQEVCFINSPEPSDTPDNTGEAEEVEVDEDESDEDDENQDANKKKNKQKNNNNEDEFAEHEFTSELEYEYEHPSKMLTREEFQELIRKNQERKREEQRKKEEEEEKRKKEEEANKKKEEEKRKKEKEEKDKKEKDRLKKQEEDKKKKMKSSKKEPITGLSSIKKNYDDNSNIASNSMINDMQNMFEIPEEKGENDEDEDDTKKNFKNNSKEKYSSKKSKNKSKSKSKKSKNKNDFDENIEKNKNKKNPKSTTEEDEETKESDNNKKSQKNPRKSNGIKKQEKKEEEKIIPEDSKEDDNEDNYSNYGDQLADNDTSPKKEKIRPKKTKKSKKGKKIEKFSYKKSLETTAPEIYHNFQNVETMDFEIKQDNGKKEFGERKKYSLRQRLPTLNHELGEKANYVYDKDGLPNLIGVTRVRTNALSENFYKAMEKINKKKKKGKKLIKGFSKKNETIQEEDEDENSDSLVSDDISEGGDDNARILRIPKGGKKSLAKNYDTVLIIKIIEANGKNMIKVNKKKYKNLMTDEQVKVDKNQEYEVLNFSDNPLIIQLLFEDLK